MHFRTWQQRTYVSFINISDKKNEQSYLPNEVRQVILIMNWHALPATRP